MRGLVVVAMSFGVLACAAKPLQSVSAAQVKITNTEPSNSCEFLGEVTGSQGNMFSGYYTSNSNLETGARNDLKNKVAAMGGNIVVVNSQRAGQSGFYQTDVTMGGTAYRCPGST